MVTSWNAPTPSDILRNTKKRQYLLSSGAKVERNSPFVLLLGLTIESLTLVFLPDGKEPACVRTADGLEFVWGDYSMGEDGCQLQNIISDDFR